MNDRSPASWNRAPARPPGMDRAREIARGDGDGRAAARTTTSPWGRGAEARRASDPARGPARDVAPSSAVERHQRPSMFDHASGLRDGRVRGMGEDAAAPRREPVIATFGRTNSAPRPGYDVPPPPGMEAGERPRPSLLAGVRERQSLLSQQRPPAVRVETQTSGVLGGGERFGSSGLGERESGELASASGAAGSGIAPTPTPTSDATPKKRKLGGWGQALARAKTPTPASGTDAPSAMKDEMMNEREIRDAAVARTGSVGDMRAKTATPTLTSGAATPTATPASGGWGAAAARATSTPVTPKVMPSNTPDHETVAKARATEQRLKVTKEALLSQMERVDAEVAELEKELEVLKKSGEDEKRGASMDSKDELSRHKRETEALRQRLANAERAAQRAQDLAVSKMREASVLLRESASKRARGGAVAEVKRANQEASAFAAKAIQQMIHRREARVEQIERDLEHNKKLAAASIDRIKTEYRLPLMDNVQRVDFDAVVAQCVKASQTPKALEVASRVREILQKRRRAVSEKHYTNTLAYLKQREIWRVRLVQEANARLAKEYVDGSAKKRFTPGSRQSGRNRSTNDLSTGVARSEYEEMQMIKALQRTEELRRMTTIPDMILDPEELRVSVFDSRNNLVEDPVAERDRINRIRPWTKAEKKIFHEKFAAYGKNFRRISEHLEGRDTGDCVMYYYKFQKTDDGFRGRRRAAMKKRRAYADAQRMREIDPAKIEAQREERSAPTAEARLERAALAAAAKAAKAKARAEKAKAKAAKEAEEAKANAGKPPSKGPEWTDMEKTKFVSGLLQYGKDFVAISSTIRTRSLDAVQQFYEDNRELMDLDSLIGTS
ncbi:hypothetical protein BE221DRAFT_187764 [Ostreococcus tauri]|uniref:SANT domain-containing protein n=1 Tax=Ostreococcus tauri TaxID=70448 RepID=A0A1Y5HX16_OSTTA|nr:hypothetical protein BE221DRAFT_187764 [Ostreococcus tauri]